MPSHDPSRNGTSSAAPTSDWKNMMKVPDQIGEAERSQLRLSRAAGLGGFAKRSKPLFCPLRFPPSQSPRVRGFADFYQRFFSADVIVTDSTSAAVAAFGALVRSIKAG
jgi:hypothetical protein